MGIEIERKFLVDISQPKIEELKEIEYSIIQGYLNFDPNRTVRVRIMGDNAWLTVKGLNDGITRAEYEYPIPYDDAREMIELCEEIITKTRYLIPLGSKIIELDKFHGDNEGLIIAEIEFKESDPGATMSSKELMELLPQWITKEVSHNPNYYNSCLIKQPYKDWTYD